VPSSHAGADADATASLPIEIQEDLLQGRPAFARLLAVLGSGKLHPSGVPLSLHEALHTVGTSLAQPPGCIPTGLHTRHSPASPLTHQPTCMRNYLQARGDAAHARIRYLERAMIYSHLIALLEDGKPEAETAGQEVDHRPASGVVLALLLTLRPFWSYAAGLVGGIARWSRWR